MAIERVIRDVFRKQAFAFFFRDADDALVTLTIGSGIELSEDEDDLATITLSGDDLDRAAGHYWWVITDTAIPVPLAYGPLVLDDPRAGVA